MSAWRGPSCSNGARHRHSASEVIGVAIKYSRAIGGDVIIEMMNHRPKFSPRS
jgi:hypothetical protein